MYNIPTELEIITAGFTLFYLLLLVIEQIKSSKYSTLERTEKRSLLNQSISRKKVYA